jgi:hypothetical protein
VGVTQNHWAPRANQVNVLVVVYIPDATANALHEVARVTAHTLEGANRAAHATRDNLLRALVPGQGLLNVLIH